MTLSKATTGLSGVILEQIKWNFKCEVGLKGFQIVSKRSDHESCHCPDAAEGWWTCSGIRRV